MSLSVGTDFTPSVYGRGMDLPVMPPVRPMLAKSVKGIPDPSELDGLCFELEWDHFASC